MFASRHGKFAALVVFGSLAASCDFSDPKAEDPTAIFGCYIATDAPSLVLTKYGVQLHGLSEALPFRYEYRKVGYVLNVPMIAENRQGRLTLLNSTSHFYRVIPSDAGPTIVVVTYPDGQLVNYKRSAPGYCA